jgi:hypothetical protein
MGAVKRCCDNREGVAHCIKPEWTGVGRVSAADGLKARLRRDHSSTQTVTLWLRRMFLTNQRLHPFLRIGRNALRRPQTNLGLPRQPRPALNRGQIEDLLVRNTLGIHPSLRFPFQSIRETATASSEPSGLIAACSRRCKLLIAPCARSPMVVRSEMFSGYRTVRRCF